MGVDEMGMNKAEHKSSQQITQGYLNPGGVHEKANHCAVAPRLCRIMQPQHFDLNGPMWPWI